MSFNKQIKPNYDFNGKVVLIAGGSSGMGFAAAKQFHDYGAQVFVLDKNSPSEDVAGIKFFACDVANYETVQKVVQRIVDETKRIDHLFTNSGVLLSARFIDSTMENISNTIDINLKGTIQVLKQVLPVMVAQNSGSIVLMGSDQSLIGKSGNAIYGCTKAAIAQLAKSLAVEYAAHNIRVNCVCPGTIDTPFTRNAVTNYAKCTGIDQKLVFEELANAQPIKRLGTAEEVANVVTFLCSDLASYITGALISVDGGYVAQ